MSCLFCIVDMNPRNGVRRTAGVELRLIPGGRLERERRRAERLQKAKMALLVLCFSAAVALAMVAYVRLVLRL